MSMPLVLAALFFAVLATVEWRRLPVIARIYLGVGTAFAIGAMMHPGMNVADAVEQANDGIAVLLAAARVAGFAAVMVSVATALRQAVRL
jgi:membrane-associated protease RseP (regulator of RpoE activity)